MIKQKFFRRIASIFVLVFISLICSGPDKQIKELAEAERKTRNESEIRSIECPENYVQGKSHSYEEKREGEDERWRKGIESEVTKWRERISISFEPPSCGTVGISFFSFPALRPFAAFVASTFYYPNATLVLSLFRANQAFADFSRILAILFADKKQFVLRKRPFRCEILQVCRWKCVTCVKFLRMLV